MEEFVIRYYFDDHDYVQQKVDALGMLEAVTMAEEQLKRACFSFPTIDHRLEMVPNEYSLVYSANVRYCRVMSGAADMGKKTVRTI